MHVSELQNLHVSELLGIAEEFGIEMPIVYVNKTLFLQLCASK